MLTADSSDAMLKNYFKIAWRNLMKNKTFSFINIFGLTIGLASFLLISLYVFDELTYDRFHKDADNIYRVIESGRTAEGKETKNAATAFQISEAGKSALPEIKDIARITALGRTNISTLENTNVFYEDFWISNPGFLTTFDFKLLQGNRNTALNEPHSVILTTETAEKLFGTTQVLGKVIKTDQDSVPFKITGVLQNFPTNSHLAFNLCFSESSLTDPGFKQFVNADWSSNSFPTYLKLSKKANPHAVEARINQLVAANKKSNLNSKSSYLLQPIKDIHFYSNGIEGNLSESGNITYIYVFIIIAFFVLLIACINYMNLTTARFAKRAKEIAVRKVAGASRQNLTGQFLSEAFLVTVIALLLALIVVKVLLPSFNIFTEKQLTLGLQTDYRIWLGIVFIIVFVGIISGIYPALFQSRLRPLVLLKGKVNIGKGNLSLRRSLVVFQFAISITMIVATLVVYMQMQYVNKKDMGFNKDQLLVIDINSGNVRRSAETIKSEIAKLSNVIDVALSSRVPGEWKAIPKIKVKHENVVNSEGSDMYFLGADDQFLKTYQIKLINGRNFIKGSIADSNSVLINETAAKQLGITSLSEQKLQISAEQPFAPKIIGIVKDFNFQSLREPVSAMVIGFQNNPVQSIDYFTVRVSTDQVSKTLPAMEAIIHNIDQNHLFEYHFLDKQWNLFYRQDQIREKIFLVVAMLTIVIACLGLFGLATYTAEQRIKEIGIRKVLGASVSSIVSMLSKDFLKLVLIAALVAFPISWWAMHKWLQDFAYHIDISWWFFAIAGGLATLIALITISFQSIKAALANPVKNLRTE
ncbi:MAG: FtsX-like permease family protein [Daejeonella sp.]|nr:FtsX-like permease family protein [Daejeonella sp.]